MRALLINYPPYGPWDVEREALERVGGTLEVVGYEELLAAPRPAELILNAAAAPFPPALLDRIPGCRCVVSYGVGTDFIDASEAKRRRITVLNMPLANVEEVATHTLALLLACTRRLRELDSVVRGGGFDWPRSKPLHRLRGRRLGLLAFGNIARRFAELAAPLGMRVAAYDPFVSAEVMQAAGVASMDADALVAWADVLSVHLPSTPATREFLDVARLQALREGAIILVTSRGDVYDLDALVDALGRGEIAAAGLDVFPDEPLAGGHPVTTLGNVVLSPHIAGYSEEAIEDLHVEAARMIEAFAGVGLPGRPV